MPAVPGVAGRRGQLDPLDAQLRTVQGLLDRHDDRRIIARSVPRALELPRQQARAVPACGRVALAFKASSAMTRAARGSLIWPRMSSPACCSSGAVKAGSELRQEPQGLAAMQPPGQAEVLAQRGRRLVGRAGGDERLVAIDREIRRQRHVAMLPLRGQIHRAEERAVEERVR